MNRFRNVVLRKCKSLSRVAAGRPSASSYSYSSLRSMSTRDATAAVVDGGAADATESVRGGGGGAVAVLVGSSRRRYVISAEHLSHPLVAALIDDDDGRQKHKDQPVAVNCEVVLFDHLLWMLDNAVDLHEEGDDDAMRELAQLYAC